jgi:hypothetical protein
MALLYGRAGRLTAQNGGFRPGQIALNFGPNVSTFVLPAMAFPAHGPGPPGAVKRL